MTRLRAGELEVDADLAVFDKDGTLIDFHAVWGGRGQRAVAALGDALDAAQREALLRTLGIDSASGRVDGRGILAQLPHAAIQEACLQTLVGMGLPPAAARDLLDGPFARIMRAPPQPHEMAGIGDVAGLFAGLRAVGVVLGVLTTDDRDATLATLASLALNDQVAHVVCGDDPCAPKPAPDGIVEIAAAVRVPPRRALMVGDTAADMRAGRAAGCVCVAVASGAGDPRELAALADAVIDSVHDIAVVRAG